jgi:lactoylglutathione lyase
MFSASLRTTARRLPAVAVKKWTPLRTLVTSPRPFTILGVQQIALGSTDKAGMDKLWIDIFGLKAESTHRLEKENVIEDILRVGAAKSPFAVEVDLMQPIDPDKSPKVS